MLAEESMADQCLLMADFVAKVGFDLSEDGVSVLVDYVSRIF